MRNSVTLEDGKALPIWKQPIALLFIMSAAMPLSFSVLSALLNNFTVEVIVFIIFTYEQTLACMSLLILGAQPPSKLGFLT